jgi:ketosteroid isomerase-like protein
MEVLRMAYKPFSSAGGGVEPAGGWAGAWEKAQPATRAKRQKRFIEFNTIFYTMTPVETVLAFLECINSGEADRVAAMLTEDPVFIDGLGQTIRGRETMRAGWRGYYEMCPDYRVSHHTIFGEGKQVAVFGEAGGAIARDGKLPAENRWCTPAAWLAVVEDGMIREWRVYADNKPVYDILAKYDVNTGKAGGARSEWAP